tara:strand:- start:3049 stop:4566 length:1518 start_codon:yes stop_codon:yes gene_type:complete
MNRRIIRLTTHDDRAIFDNHFNQDIEIKPNSKVALLNFTAKLKVPSIVIQGDNRKFSYNLGHPTNAPETTDIILTEGVYTNATSADLVKDFETKLLESLHPQIKLAGSTTGNSRMIGLNWSFDVKADSKTQITWTQALKDEYTAEQVLTNTTRTTSNNGIVKRTGGTAGTKDAFLGYKSPLVVGGGIFNCKLGDWTDRSTGDIEKCGMILCLLNKDPTGMTTVADTDIVIGVQPVELSQKFRVWKNGTQTTHATEDFTPAMYSGSGNSDNVRFNAQYKLGGLTAGYYLDSEYTELISLSQTEVQALSDGIKTPLYPCVVFLGVRTTDTSVFGKVQTRLTLTTLQSGVPSNSLLEFGANDVPRQTRAVRQNFIEFGTLELAQYFGYNDKRQPKGGTISARDKLTYLADVDFTAGLVSADNYIFQLLSQDLDCYDGLSSSRKNILMTMPNIRTADLTIDFQTNTPIYLSFRNHSSFSLRNLRARILDYDNQEIAVAGLTNATIVIED